MPTESKSDITELREEAEKRKGREWGRERRIETKERF